MMSLAAPVEECVPTPSCQVRVFSRRRHFQIVETVPQAPKLSTALLGRNRSGSGRGGSRVASVRQGDLGPTTRNVERKAECHDDTVLPASGLSARAAAANADTRVHPCPTLPCQSKPCTSRDQSMTRTRRDAQRPRTNASARPRTAGPHSDP